MLAMPRPSKVECDAPTRSRFPDIYREFEALQGRVRQAAQDYIVGPQVGPLPLEVRNIEVSSGPGSGSTVAQHFATCEPACLCSRLPGLWGSSMRSTR